MLYYICWVLYLCEPKKFLKSQNHVCLGDAVLASNVTRNFESDYKGLLGVIVESFQ